MAKTDEFSSYEDSTINAQDIIRLRHMLDSASKIIEFTKNCDRNNLDRDEKLALSIVRLLEILGEAAKSISDQCRKQYPKIPWREIAGTRDRLIHGYFDIDLNIVWKIISADIPSLKAQLIKILNKS